MTVTCRLPRHSPPESGREQSVALSHGGRLVCTGQRGTGQRGTGQRGTGQRGTGQRGTGQRGTGQRGTPLRDQQTGTVLNIL